IPTLTTIWAAGVRANKIVEESGIETNRGKIEVREDMRAPDYDDVFVVGDCALIMNPHHGRTYRPTAQIAIQQADTIARNIKALIDKNEKTMKFKANLKGTVASLGNDDAIGVVMDDRRIFGWQATFMKKMIDNRYLLKLGGWGLMLKKGKFNIFYQSKSKDSRLSLLFCLYIIKWRLC